MTKPEIWGRCPSCVRWFPCPDWFQRDREHPTCPQCGIEPTHIENRAPRRRSAHVYTRQHREDLRESIGNALSYTQQLWGLSRTLSGAAHLSAVADQLGALELALESELRRAEQIATELERLSELRAQATESLRLEATA